MTLNLPDIPEAVYQGFPMACGLLAVVVLVVRNLRKKRENKLNDILLVFFTACALPTALLLMYGGFNEVALSRIQDIKIYIVASGIGLIHVSCETLKEKFFPREKGSIVDEEVKL